MAVRWACSEDLKNYFRIRDLLGGLTEDQYKVIRANLGINVSEGGQQTPTELTHAQLEMLISNNALTTGARYIISDFQTIYLNNVGTVWGQPGSEHESMIMPLLVTAVNTSTLDPRVLILSHLNHYAEYDVSSETIQGVKTKGKITKMISPNNNSAPYDFISVRFRRTYKDGVQDVTRDLFTFSTVLGDQVINNYTSISVHNNHLGHNCWNNVFIGDTYYNNFDADCTGNTFYSGCHDCHFKWESVNNDFFEEVVDVTGTIANKTVQVGDDKLSSAITKYIHIVQDRTIVTFLDPVTYAWQIVDMDDFKWT